jgi:hypothetical protein
MTSPAGTRAITSEMSSPGLKLSLSFSIIFLF